jgi:hypothetical protein
MKLAVVGSRSFTDWELLKRSIDGVRQQFQLTEIISGGARGADSLAERYARENNLKLILFIPDWSLGRGAGILRNRDIIAAADLVIAFWDGESKGTKNSLEVAAQLQKKGWTIRF